MTGIYGKISAAGVAPDEIGRMLAPVRHYDWYREERWVADDTALVSLSLGWGGSKLYAGAEDVVALAGEIYDAAEHRRRLAAEGVKFQGDSQAELCLQAYKRHGRAFFADVNGKFAVAIWEGMDRRLTSSSTVSACCPVIMPRSSTVWHSRPRSPRCLPEGVSRAGRTMTRSRHSSRSASTWAMRR